MKGYVILVAVLVLIALKVASWGYDVVSSSVALQQNTMAKVEQTIR